MAIILTVFLVNLPICFYFVVFPLMNVARRDSLVVGNPWIKLILWLLIEQLLRDRHCAGGEDTGHHEFCSAFLHSLVSHVSYSQFLSFFFSFSYRVILPSPLSPFAPSTPVFLKIYL